MPRLAEKLLLLVALAAVAAGCKPKIGDDCRISTDCSAAGDRLCDITAPGGYCTIFSCEPGTCPEDESLCVEFGARRSVRCDPEYTRSPYARTFCMAHCDSNSDCRSGYVCADVGDTNNPWGAQPIDTNRGNKVCLVPASDVQIMPTDGDEDQVCVFKKTDDAAQGGSAGSPAATPASAGAGAAAADGGAAPADGGANGG
jgi:hypothetical protein